MNDNSYSRLVSWLKILLPLLALALLSTLFLVARTVDPAQNLPFADVDVDEIARDQRIGKPNYSGVTADGASVSVTADHAQPDPDRLDALTGQGAKAKVELENGVIVDIRSDVLDIDNSAGVARLTKDVRLETSDGYALNSEVIEISLDRTRLASNETSVMTGPAGSITADSFELTRETVDDQNYLMVFKGNVKLVYGAEE